MKLIKDTFLEFALKIENEINSDTSDWFKPKGPVRGGPGPGDFDYGQMRFVNRNLNYFYYENMILHALQNNYTYNQNYKNTLQFTEFLRTHLNETGPYGRMCIWKLEKNCYLLPHFDNWPYHRNIRRYIFIVSDHNNNNALIKINDQIISFCRGTLFQFYPSTELHEFINNSDTNFYFLGFDYWDVDNLSKVSLEKYLSKYSEIQYQNNFGGFGSKCKYMSKE